MFAWPFLCLNSPTRNQLSGFKPMMMTKDDDSSGVILDLAKEFFLTLLADFFCWSSGVSKVDKQNYLHHPTGIYCTLYKFVGNIITDKNVQTRWARSAGY